MTSRIWFAKTITKRKVPPWFFLPILLIAVGISNIILPLRLASSNSPKYITINSPELNHGVQGCLSLQIQRTFPIIFVHVGPPKTATTSIQDYLACNTRLLSEHHVVYLGKINPFDVQNCTLVPVDHVRSIVQNRSPLAVQTLRQQILHHISQNTTVVLSDEGFDSLPENLVESLFANMSHVYAIVGYRQYHSWLVSSYNYDYTPHWYNSQPWSEWTGNDEIPTFRSHLHQRIKRGQHHPTLVLLRHFSKLLHRATGERTCPQILHQHKNDVIPDFLSIVAHSSLHDLPPTIRTNVHPITRYAVDAERLAVQLHREESLALVLPRRAVVNVIQHRMNSLYRELMPPLECLTRDEEERLLEETMGADKLIVSYGGEREMIAAEFWNASHGGVFCNINLEEIMGDGRWGRLLMDLKKGRLMSNRFLPMGQNHHS